MRRIITLATLALSLLGGVAMADNYRGERGGVERRENRREEAREHRYFERSVRPERRFERFEARRGFRFIRGEWTWNGYEWIWAPGHYVRSWR
jgi:hypothetical protein